MTSRSVLEDCLSQILHMDGGSAGYAAMLGFTVVEDELVQEEQDDTEKPTKESKPTEDDTEEESR